MLERIAAINAAVTQHRDHVRLFARSPWQLERPAVDEGVFLR
jgi:hypothetical protein